MEIGDDLGQTGEFEIDERVTMMSQPAQDSFRESI